MARQKGSANFSGTIEPLAGGALDARNIVQAKADLTTSGSFPYPYIGMETYVVAEDKKYRLIGDDPTVIANWKDIDAVEIDVDDEISSSSTNPVQNKVIYEALDEKQDTLTAGDGIDITNDVISTENMPASDMDEIITPLPGFRSQGVNYSTDEQVIGTWIDGKPLYQKTFSLAFPTTGTTEEIDLSNLSIDSCIYLYTIINSHPNVYTVSSYNSDPTLDVTCWIKSNGKLAIRVKAGITYISSNSNIYITLQYTKTTD